MWTERGTARKRLPGHFLKLEQETWFGLIWWSGVEGRGGGGLDLSTSTVSARQVAFRGTVQSYLRNCTVIHFVNRLSRTLVFKLCDAWAQFRLFCFTLTAVPSGLEPVGRVCTASLRELESFSRDVKSVWVIIQTVSVVYCELNSQLW